MKNPHTNPEAPLIMWKLRILTHSDRQIREDALHKIGSAGANGWIGRSLRTHAMNKLQALLTDPDTEIRKRAIAALGRVIKPLDVITRGDAVIALHNMLFDPDRMVRIITSWIFKELKDRSTVLPLIKAAEEGRLDSDKAAEALVAIGDPAGVPFVNRYWEKKLDDWASGDKRQNFEVNSNAMVYLSQLGNQRCAYFFSCLLKNCGNNITWATESRSFGREEARELVKVALENVAKEGGVVIEE